MEPGPPADIVPSARERCAPPSVFGIPSRAGGQYGASHKRPCHVPGRHHGSLSGQHAADRWPRSPAKPVWPRPNCGSLMTGRSMVLAAGLSSAIQRSNSAHGVRFASAPVACRGNCAAHDNQTDHPRCARRLAVVQSAIHGAFFVLSIRQNCHRGSAASGKRTLPFLASQPFTHSPSHFIGTSRSGSSKSP